MGFNAAQWIWQNGEFVPWQNATVHVLSHGLQYGSTVFEGIRAYDTPRGSAIFRLREHISRLYDSARIYRMQVKYTPAQIEQACRDLIRNNRLFKGAYLRPIISRGMSGFSLAPKPDAPIEVAIAAVEMGAYLGSESLEQGVDACVSSWQRIAPNTMPTLAKAGGNYLSSQLISMEAQRHGYAEGIAVGTDGMLSEGGGENLFLVRKGALYTPPVGAAILAGITRDSIITLARDIGLEVREQSLPRDPLDRWPCHRRGAARAGHAAIAGSLLRTLQWPHARRARLARPHRSRARDRVRRARGLRLMCTRTRSLVPA
jgi:branched-chain amino acid aminotransferase